MKQVFRYFDGYRVDPATRRLWRGEKPVDLTRKEYELLWHLVVQPGTIVSHEALLEALWPDTGGSKENLRKQVQYLRRKLGTNPEGLEYIENVPNRGYLLNADVTIDHEEDSTQDSACPVPGPTPAIQGGHRLSGTLLVSILVGILLSTLALVAFRISSARRSSAPTLSIGRVLVHATSEGRSLTAIPVPHRPVSLAISADGKQLYSVTPWEKTLSVVDTATWKTVSVPLPRGGDYTQALRDGRVVIASYVDGVMIWNPRHGGIVQVVPTGGPVLDLAVTPDGDRAFLAMGTLGLKRLSLRTLEQVQISDRSCPVYVALDPSASHLYVSYQCTGPSGKRGQDEMEVYDTATESLLWKASGFPMVGGLPFISPDGRLLSIDGQDVCWNPTYSHIGCPPGAENVFHLIRISDHQLLRSLGLPIPAAPAGFVDASRLLINGDALTVLQTSRYTVLERLAIDSPVYGAAVLSPSRKRFYLASQSRNVILAGEMEDAGCSGPEGAAMMFTGDGTWDDALGLARLEPHGKVSFRPGRVGQAFLLPGNSFLATPDTDYYEFLMQDGAVSLYVKFEDLQGERTLLYRMTDDEKGGMHLFKTAGNSIACRVALKDGSQAVITGGTPVIAGRWIHIGVTRNDRQLTLYINGAAASTTTLAADPAPAPLHTPLYLGADRWGRNSVAGLLDEIAFYRRGLSADELRGIYDMRESGPCRP